MNVGSLFSGIGGIEFGFEAEGFHTEWFVECEPYAQSILRKHWPNATIYEDITQIDWTTVPKVDVLTGGFPCQDISNAGKRVGIKGSRSSLWKYYCEAIRILRPKYAFIENVAALAQRGLNVVLADLAKIGYDAEWYNLSASSVGAFHRRERLFIIAYASYTRHEWFRGEQCKKSLSETNANVANTNSSGWIYRQTQEFTTKGRFDAFSEPFTSSTDVSNTDNKRQQGSRKEQVRPEELSENASNVENTISIGNDARNWNKDIGGEAQSRNTNQSQRAGWWATEPELGRVATGVSHRVDRIKCLGNAVVPQCAQVFAQAIKEIESHSQDGGIRSHTRNFRTRLPSLD